MATSGRPQHQKPSSSSKGLRHFCYIITVVVMATAVASLSTADVAAAETHGEGEAENQPSKVDLLPVSGDNVTLASRDPGHPSLGEPPADTSPVWNAEPGLSMRPDEREREEVIDLVNFDRFLRFLQEKSSSQLVPSLGEYDWQMQDAESYPAVEDDSGDDLDKKIISYDPLSVRRKRAAGDVTSLMTAEHMMTSHPAGSSFYERPSLRTKRDLEVDDESIPFNQESGDVFRERLMQDSPQLSFIDSEPTAPPQVDESSVSNVEVHSHAESDDQSGVDETKQKQLIRRLVQRILAQKAAENADAASSLNFEPDVTEDVETQRFDWLQQNPSAGELFEMPAAEAEAEVEPDVYRGVDEEFDVPAVESPLFRIRRSARSRRSHLRRRPPLPPQTFSVDEVEAAADRWSTLVREEVKKALDEYDLVYRLADALKKDDGGAGLKRKK